jgi:hypothetical protein
MSILQIFKLYKKVIILKMDSQIIFLYRNKIMRIIIKIMIKIIYFYSNKMLFTIISNRILIIFLCLNKIINLNFINNRDQNLEINQIQHKNLEFPQVIKGYNKTISN